MEKQESTEIRRQFVSSSFLPDFKIGVNFAIFIVSGKMPRFIDSLKIFSSSFFMNSYTDVIIFTSKPSWREALFLLSV